MSAPQLRAAARITLAVGAVAALAWIAHLGGGLSSLLDLPTLWTLLPYALFFAASAFARSRGQARALLWVCALATLPALLLYVATFLVSFGFTNAIVLLFVPFYQVVPAAIMLAVLFFTRNDAASKSRAA